MEITHAVDYVIRYGYVTIFLVIAIENIEFFGSIPTSIIATAVGAASSQKIFNPVIAVTILTLASITGDVIAYWIGRSFGRPLLERWGGPLLKNGRLEIIERFFVRFGVFGVFISRFIFASFQAVINIIAGVAKMRFMVFFFAALLGEFVWSLFYFLLGYYFWPRVKGWLAVISSQNPLGVILLLAAMIVAAILIIRWRRKKRQQTQ